MPDDYRVPTPEEHRTMLRELARHIESKLPPGRGFGLFIFQFGDEPGDMLWISNGRRPDMLKALQEFLQKQAS